MRLNIMTNTIIWQQHSDNPDNLSNFNTICQWWSNLENQEVNLAQRLIPDNGNLDEIDWQTQQFDEKFVITAPQVRGITLYGKKPNQEQELNFTASELELNLDENELYIYLQSRNNVLIKVWQTPVNYQQISLNNFEIASQQVGKDCVILLRDKEQKVEVSFSLKTDQQLYLLSQLAKILKLNAKLNLSPETLSELLNMMQK